MLRLHCSNPDCRWHTEVRGGTFHFHNHQCLCSDCYFLRPVLNAGKNLWDFETTNLDPSGKRIKVSSVGQLRQLEKQHGVVSVAANMDQRHWNTAPQTRR